MKGLIDRLVERAIAHPSAGLTSCPIDKRRDCFACHREARDKIKTVLGWFIEEVDAGLPIETLSTLRSELES